MIRIGGLAQGLSIACTGVLLSLPLPTQQTPTQRCTQTNLVTDTSGPAQATDPRLVNPWGLSRGSTTPWWVSDNGPGLATLYGGTRTAETPVIIHPAVSNSSDH
jgi:hypothetical protein